MREGRESLLTEVHHPDVAGEGEGVVGVAGVVPAALSEHLPPLLHHLPLLVQRDGGPGPGPVAGHVRHPVLVVDVEVGRTAAHGDPVLLGEEVLVSVLPPAEPSYSPTSWMAWT